MKVFNLSDATPPYKPARRARALKIMGVPIKPGEFGDVPDTVPTSEFSGLLVSNMVSIDTVPEWYRQAKAAAEKLAVEEKVEEPVLEVPEPDGPDYGAMAEEEEEPESEEGAEPTEENKRSKKRRKRS